MDRPSNEIMKDTLIGTRGQHIPTAALIIV